MLFAKEKERKANPQANFKPNSWVFVITRYAHILFLVILFPQTVGGTYFILKPIKHRSTKT